MVPGLLPDQACRDVWEETPDALVGVVLAPSTGVVPVAGGYQLSGRWPYCSGIDHCDWNIVSGFDSVDGGPPDIRLFLVPKRDYTIEDTWFALGLRGTGSKTTVIDNAFVPAHRTIPMRLIRDGVPQAGKRDMALFYKVPFGAFFPLSLASPIIGIALGALESWMGAAARRATYSGQPVREQTVIQVCAAEASAEIDCACLLVQSGAREAIRSTQSL